MSRIFIALIVEIALAIPIIYFLEKLREKIDASIVLEWMYSHIGLPFARVILVLIFILSAYPALYGVDLIPSLGNVLLEHSERIHSLINWLFVSSLVIPFIPMVGIIPALVIPIQAILATAMLFNWAAPISTISLVPSIWVFLLFLVLSIVTHKFAKLFAQCQEKLS